MTIESADEFVRLRLSADPADYGRAAHDDAPAHVWDEVIATRPEMKKWVAHNKTVPQEVLRTLAQDDDPEVRWWVASKRKLDPELFAALAADRDATVRHRVACNAKVPRPLLLKLAEDNEDFVAEAARSRL